jgi:hypothetical protein
MELNKRIKCNIGGTLRILHIIRKEDSILASNSPFIDNSSEKRPNEKRGEDTNEMKLKVYLEEYKTLSDEISRRVGFQQQLLHYYLILVGMIVAFIRFVIVDSSNSISSALISSVMSLDYTRLFLLLTPIIFISISLIFSRHDVMIVSIAKYINKDLRPRIKDLTNDENILRWQYFITSERKKTSNLFIMILPSLGEDFLLPFLFPIIFLALYYNYNGLAFNIYYTLLFLFDFFFLLFSICLKLLIANSYKEIV